MSSHPSRSDDAKTIETIRAIPGAMRQMGWGTSAALMDRWLRSAAWRLPESWKGKDSPAPEKMPQAHVDQRIVRMHWALSYPRMRIEMETLRAKLANIPAQQNLRDRVFDSRWGTAKEIEFGTIQLNAVQLDSACQANFEKFGSGLDTMDDLYGGLGRGVMKAALIGKALRDTRTRRCTLNVTHVGYYIRDSYDFNGPQYLGRWNKERVLGKAETIRNTIGESLTFQWGKPAGHVSNADFETYRRITGFGGDFVVYSDVLWQPLRLTLTL